MRNKRKHKLYLGLVIAMCFIIATPIISALFLDDLEDVIITTPYHNQLIQYNSTLVNWTNINYTAVGDGYAGAEAHPHNQGLNTTDNVLFGSVDVTGDIFTFLGDILIARYFPRRLYLGESQEGQIYVEGDETRLVIDAQNTVFGLSMIVSGGDDMAIDTAGIITTPQQSACRVRLKTIQSVPSSVFTKLMFYVEDYDQNNDYDNEELIRFDVPVTGLYHISYSVYIADLADTTLFMGGIYKNGVLVGGFEFVQASTAFVTNCAFSGSDILQLTVNDYIELYVYHNAVGSRTLLAVAYSNYMAICKIS